MSITGKVVIKRVALKRMKPAAYNPRKDLRPGDAEWAELERSLEVFGYVDPLVWNKQTGNLVGGHQRYKVLVHRGVKTADVSVVDLDPAREKLLNLALNKVKGAWDDDGLAALLEELESDKAVAALGGVALSGFGEKEIAAICKDGDRLVELLVPKDVDEEESEEEGEGGGGGPKVFNLLVRCGTKKRQGQLFRKLQKENWDVEQRTR